jgi:tRNA pseudouridine synthase 10
MTKNNICNTCLTRLELDKSLKSDINQEMICDICHNIFTKVDNYKEKIISLLKNYEYNSFNIGVIQKKSILEKEEIIVEELDRTKYRRSKLVFGDLVAKEISEITKKSFDKENYELNIIIDLKKNKIIITPKPIFIYGLYKKFKRNIPQTKWPCSKCRGLGCKICDFTGQQYKESVESLIAEKFEIISKCEGSSFHGAGREDIDALNLGGREFVLELTNPKIRTYDLNNLQKEINQINKNKVEISNIRYSNKKEVINLKEKKADKTYRALCILDSKIKKDDLKKLDSLIGTIVEQRTPNRVSHRRGDLIRKRKVVELSYNFLNENEIELFIKGEAGLYIKELVSGDENRTIPSVSEILKTKVIVKELDVIKIENIQ